MYSPTVVSFQGLFDIFFSCHRGGALIAEQSGAARPVFWMDECLC
jgi:hypothetical protein